MRAGGPSAFHQRRHGNVAGQALPYSCSDMLFISPHVTDYTSFFKPNGLPLTERVRADNAHTSIGQCNHVKIYQYMRNFTTRSKTDRVIIARGNLAKIWEVADHFSDEFQSFAPQYRKHWDHVRSAQVNSIGCCLYTGVHRYRQRSASIGMVVYMLSARWI